MSSSNDSCRLGQSGIPVNETSGCRSTIPKNRVNPPPLMNIIGLEPSNNSSIRRPLGSDDSDSDFQMVNNNKNLSSAV